MNYTVGIDLGSTTTKAVVLGENGAVLGRGITNSRSNYDVACQVALGEALINTRFSLIAGEFRSIARDPAHSPVLIGALERTFRAEQYRSQLRVLDTELRRFLARLLTKPPAAAGIVDRIVERMTGEVDALYAEGARRKSDFFRDLAGSQYRHEAEQLTRVPACGSGREGPSFDALTGLFDKGILEVENTPAAAASFETFALAAAAGLAEPMPELHDAVWRALETPLEEVASVGTGYGRARLP
ncbi:MAG: benzoyl-CoA reductase subunit A, partial [Acidobacteriota bacterium]|nr:benzoyl-CoA reductase subunit A [Acidobacteriota bacterium]